MTKAFTSALGYGVTVRGYIDEDDRLVLLEPEGGGGGGGDFDTIQLKISGSAPLYEGLFPVIEENLMVAMSSLETGTTYEAVTYKGACGILLNKNSDSMSVAATNATVSEIDDGFAIRATGDCVITVTG